MTMSQPTQPTPRFVLLAAVDESAAADLVLAQTAAAARTTPGAEVHLLHVPDRFTHDVVKPTTFDLGHGREYMTACARRLREQTSAPIIGHVLEREPGAAIVQLAINLDADLVIVGTKDKSGPARWVLGSVARRVMEHAPCPVLVVRAKSQAVYPPEIEPPCPDCLAEQRASRGATLWCARHREHHPRAHVHYETPEGFGAGSSLVQG